MQKKGLELKTIDRKVIDDNIAKSKIKEGKVVFLVESCFEGTKKYVDILYEIAKVELAS